MNLIRIEGSRAQLLELDSIQGLVVVQHATTQLADDRFTVSAYAPDDTLSEIAARGCIVHMITPSDELDQVIASLYDEIEPETESS